MLESKRWLKSYAGKAMEHPLFRQNAMNYGAWMFLIGMAAWKETRFDVQGKTVTLKRGQLCASERHLAKTFGASRSWVTRFLDRLKTEQMIEISNEAGKNILTICNYSKYQDIVQKTDLGTEPLSEPQNNSISHSNQREKMAFQAGTEPHCEPAAKDRTTIEPLFEPLSEPPCEPLDGVVTNCIQREKTDFEKTPNQQPNQQPNQHNFQNRTTNIERRNIITTVENNNKTNISDFSDFSADENQARIYAFAGAVIRLNQADLEKWKSIYHAIPDLIAELHQLDDYYATQPADEVKNWFHRAKSALNKKHQARLQARTDAGAAGTPSGGGIGETDYAAMRKRQAERDEAEAREIARHLAGGGETMEFHETAFA